MLIGNVHRTPKLSKYECSCGSPEVLLQLSVKRIKSLEPQIWGRRITIGWISWSNLETRSKSAVETLPSPLECQRTGSWRTESSTRRCPREASSRRWGFGGWCWRCKPVYTTNTTEKSGTTMLRSESMQIEIVFQLWIEPTHEKTLREDGHTLSRSIHFGPLRDPFASKSKVWRVKGDIGDTSWQVFVFSP